MPSEADTCRTLVTPKLQAAGWEQDPHSIAEQRFFTDGRIVVRGNTAERRKGKRADYILRYTRDFPIAVVEAKSEDEPAAQGLQQAKDYAGILGLKFAYATQEEIDEAGKTTKTEILTAENAEDTEEETALHETPPPYTASFQPSDFSLQPSKKFYFDGGQVEIAAELVHELDADGKQLRVVKLTDYTAEKVRSLCARPEDLRARWADAGQRADILQQMAERGIDFAQVAAQAGQPDADPFDLLCHLAFPPAGLDEASARRRVLTRRQRADGVKRQQAAFFHYYQPEAREILSELLEKYAVDGELQFVLPDVLKLPPISHHGTVGEIANVFGGPDELRSAVNQLQTLLYTE